MVHDVSPCTIPEKPDTSRKSVMVLHYLAAMPDTEVMSLNDDAPNGGVVDISTWTERTGIALSES